MPYQKPYNDAPTRRIRVTRTLVFEGPEDWIRGTLDKSWLSPELGDRLGGGDKSAIETDRVEEIL